MDTHTRIQTFCCPVCGGNIGEASTLDQVRGAITRPSLRTIFDMLAERPGRAVQRDAIIDALYGHRADGGPEHADHITKVFVSQIRRAIEPFGWTVTVSRGGSGSLAQWKLIPTEASA